MLRSSHRFKALVGAAPRWTLKRIGGALKQTSTMEMLESRNVFVLEQQVRSFSSSTSRSLNRVDDDDGKRIEKLPLEGLKVLDLSRVLAGPYCTQLLADLGATVIKIEPPKVGDDTRTWGPPFMEVVGEDAVENQSGYFQCANRGKKSITVNLKSKNGQKILHELVKNCDVLIENFKVGSLEKFGLDYKTAKSINPDLIYCSITGYGQDSSKSHLPGYDFVMQAMSGVMSITGDQNTPPFKVGIAITDIMTGMYAAVGILSKIVEKQGSKESSPEGKKDWIDVSLLDCNLAYLANQATNYLQTGTSPKRIGNKHPNIAPYEVIKCSNGDVVVTVGNDGQFNRFISVISKKGEVRDLEKFKTNQQRVANRPELIKQIEDITSVHFLKEDLIEELNKADVPCGPVNNIKEALSEPIVSERNMIWTFDNPSKDDTHTTRPVQTIGNPLKFIDEHHQHMDLRKHTTRPPILSEHTKQVLRQYIGASEQDIEQWEKEGTI